MSRVSQDLREETAPSAETPPVTGRIEVSELVRARTRLEAALVALRLARTVARRFGLEPVLEADGAGPGPSELADEALSASVRFVREYAVSFGLSSANEAGAREEIASLRRADDPHPINRLLRVYPPDGRGETLIDLALLSGLPELHEGFAAFFRLLHPEGRPYPTVTLAVHWLEEEAAADPQVTDVHGEPLPEPARRMFMRDQLETLLCHSAAARLGILALEGDAPWHSRTLRPGPGVWEALMGRAPQVEGATLIGGYRAVPGLDGWLSEPEVRRAVLALGRGEPCVVGLIGGTRSMRETRLRALLGAAGVSVVQTAVQAGASGQAVLDVARRAYCVAFLHGAFPCIEWCGDEVQAEVSLPAHELRWDLPVLLSVAAERAVPDFGLPLLSLPVAPLSAVERRRAWSALLPGLGTAASVLAARYPVDPLEVRNIASDLALYQRVEGRPLALDDVSDSLRARSGGFARQGVTRIVPRARWEQLLVPDLSARQLREAVLRVHQQITVLDDWGFAQGRAERRGIRMLFYGPPGTGKTLAAEAMARAIGVDLLLVDISSLVSKWIGETEKNLAAVFELAERARALLLFDEADALFGRRSEANDANDRYANLETAYLLQRLERFEGVAVLTTNLRTSLDPAFTRRFEFIVEFPEPDAPTREALWRLHLPPQAPLAPDVDLKELAVWYAMSGAQIKNAAMAAAFLAAAESGALQQRHFLQATVREFDKAGKAHPGFPPARSGGTPEGALTPSTHDVTDPSAVRFGA